MGERGEGNGVRRGDWWGSGGVQLWWPRRVGGRILDGVAGVGVVDRSIVSQRELLVSESGMGRIGTGRDQLGEFRASVLGESAVLLCVVHDR